MMVRYILLGLLYIYPLHKNYLIREVITKHLHNFLIKYIYIVGTG
ncbi:hypothetical protein BH09BAC1_BH09BAC1_15200 [soil metagenome]